MQETDQEGEVSQLFRVFDIEGTGLIGWWIANKDNVENVTKNIKYFLRRRRIWKSDDEASSGDSQRRAEGKNEDKNQKLPDVCCFMSFV